MSPRPRNSRIVFDPPKFKGYRPFGYYAAPAEPVLLLVEEYAAIRLCDYELMTQTEAAAVMGISRPTFTRLYESARRKIALAMAEARPLEIEKGHAYFNHHWYHCRNCNVFFTQPGEESTQNSCPLCRSSKIEHLFDSNEQKR